MSRGGGDNHFLSAKERDLKPLLAEGIEVLDLDEGQASQLSTFIDGAWLSGLSNGHVRLLGQLDRYRDPDCPDPRQLPPDPAHLERIEAELREMMEASAAAMKLTTIGTVTIWEALSRAWAAGALAYEEEVIASLLEQQSDVAAEAREWLDREAPG